MVRITRSASATTLAANTIRAIQVLLGIAMYLAPASGFAQGQLLGAVHGIVTDQQGGVLPGVLITATPIESRPPVTVTTDAAGFYALKELPPGEYQLKAELAGFATTVQPGVVARAGLTLSIDLAMPVGGLDEIVTVRRDSPLLETSSASSAVNINGDLQRALTLASRRNWDSVLAVVPGVITTSRPTQDQFYMHGSNFDSHVASIDGGVATRAGQNSTIGVALSAEALEDLHIATGGVDVTAPLGTGLVVAAVTKSGTNALKGSMTVAALPRRWNDSNVPGGTSPGASLWQFEAAAGGPAKRDSAWL